MILYYSNILAYLLINLMDGAMLLKGKFLELKTFVNHSVAFNIITYNYYHLLYFKR